MRMESTGSTRALTIVAAPGVTLQSWTLVNAFDQVELQVANLKGLSVKKEPGALHIQDTYGSCRKNDSSDVSGNHMQTARPLFVDNFSDNVTVTLTTFSCILIVYPELLPVGGDIG